MSSQYGDQIAPETRLRELEAELRVVRVDLSRARQALDQEQRRNGALQAEVTSLKEKAQSLQSELEAALLQQQALAQQTEQAHALADAAQQERLAAHRAMETAKLERDAALVAKEDLASQARVLKRKLQDAEEEQDKADETIAALEAEVKALQMAADLSAAADSASPLDLGGGARAADSALQQRVEAVEREKDALQLQLSQALAALAEHRDKASVAASAASAATAAAVSQAAKEAREKAWSEAAAERAELEREGQRLLQLLKEKEGALQEREEEALRKKSEQEGNGVPAAAAAGAAGIGDVHQEEVLQALRESQQEKASLEKELEGLRAELQEARLEASQKVTPSRPRGNKGEDEAESRPAAESAKSSTFEPLAEAGETPELVQRPEDAEEVEVVRRRLEGAEHKAAAAAAAAEKLKASRGKLLAEVDAQSQQIERLFQENSALAAAVKETSAISAKWEAELESTLAANEELRANTDELRTQYTSLVQQQAELKTEVLSLRQQQQGQRQGPLGVDSKGQGIDGGASLGDDKLMRENARLKGELLQAQSRVEDMNAMLVRTKADYTSAVQGLASLRRLYKPVLSGIEYKLLQCKQELAPASALAASRLENNRGKTLL